MDVSILIPVYNSEKIIENLVKQIIDSISDIKSIHSYEIILIDDFSQISILNPPPEILEIYKNVPEINEIDNRGFPICRPLFSHSSLPRDLGLKDVWVDDFDFKSSFLIFTFLFKI